MNILEKNYKEVNMKIKNAILKELELSNGKNIRVGNEVELSPHGRVMVTNIYIKNGDIFYEFNKNNEKITYDYEYVEKNVKILFDKSYNVKLVFGDWSGDGHNRYESFGIISNYDVSTIRKAYKDSCKLTGLTFNHNKDYTGLLQGRYGHWRQLFTEYESSEIEPEACAILEQFGLIEKDDWDEEDDCGIAMDLEDVPDLMMKFIALSMPKDFIYTFSDIGLLNAEPINGFYNSELNVQFGYGLF
jgi:hypothetical protein